MNPPPMHLPDILLAITLLLTISAVMIPLARRVGIGPELGLLLSGVVLGLPHLLAPAHVARLRELSELGVVFFCLSSALSWISDKPGRYGGMLWAWACCKWR